MLYKDNPDWVSVRPVDITCHSHTSMTCVGQIGIIASSCDELAIGKSSIAARSVCVQGAVQVFAADDA